MIEFLSAHWAIIATILFGISELLALNPTVKANGVFQLLFNWIQSQKA